LAALPAGATAAQSISGTVTRGGVPVSGVTVTAFIPQAGSSGAPWPTFSAVTGVDGRYTIALPYADWFRVSFTPPGSPNVYYHPGGTDYEHAEYVQVASGAAVTGIDDALPVGDAIEGTVTDASGPLADTDVWLIDDQGRSVDRGRTGSDGRYHLGPDAPGAYRVRFDPPGDRAPQYASGRRALTQADPVTIAAGRTTTGVDAAILRGGHITGTVMDVDGLPVAGATVRTLARADDPFDRVTTDVVTDAEGHYTVTGLGGDPYYVLFQPPDGRNLVEGFANGRATADLADPITVPDEGTTSGVDAVLHHGGRLTGRVTDDHGTAVPDVDVEADVPGGGDTWTSSTDADGNYVFGNLPSGDYTVVFYPRAATDLANQYYADHTVRADADRVTVTVDHLTSGVDVRLHPTQLGRISGTVFAPGGIPLAGEVVSVASLDEPWWFGDSDHTDANGHYVFHGLTPGRYTVSFAGTSLLDAQSFDGRTSGQTPTPVVVGAGQNRSGVDARMTGPSYTTAIAGTVRDGRGAPRAGARVEIYNEDGFIVGRTSTGTTGAYRVTLRPGGYRVWFALPGATGVWYRDPGSVETSKVVRVGSSVFRLDLGSSPAGPPVARPMTVGVAGPADRRGRVPLRLHCPGPAACRGSLTLTATESNRPRRIGRTTFTVGPARSDRRRLTLNATGRRLLARRAGRLRSSATVIPDGEASRSAGTITIRRSVPPRPR
jgi:hypothetical protein